MAVAMPIETCELNDADPPAGLAHVLAKPRDRPAKRRDGWPPWNWTPRRQGNRGSGLSHSGVVHPKHPRRRPNGSD